MVKVRVVFSLRVKGGLPPALCSPRINVENGRLRLCPIDPQPAPAPQDNLRPHVPAIMGCCHESDSEYDLRDHIRSIIQGAHASLSGLRQGL
jgi:hypothetical protein